jgi:hypothetical protein
MNKKTLLAYVVLIGCILLLVGSYMQWKGKISSVGGNSERIISTPTPPVAKNDEKTDETSEPDYDVERLLALTANADNKVQEVVKSRLESEEKIDFLIIGSEVMKHGEPGYAEQLKSALENAYGDPMNVSIVSIDESSDLFIENLNEEIDFNKGYDIILFEPFTLNNNGVIIAEDQHEHIEIFKNRLQSEVEDAVLVLHPPQPLHRAIHYPNEVKSIKSFAKDNKIPHIDHWTEWPDINSDELPDFLDEDKMPNRAGAEVWADALINYFIAE